MRVGVVELELVVYGLGSRDMLDGRAEDEVGKTRLVYLKSGPVGPLKRTHHDVTPLGTHAPSYSDRGRWRVRCRHVWRLPHPPPHPPPLV